MKCRPLSILVVIIILLAWVTGELSAQNEPKSLLQVFDSCVSLGFKTQLQWDSIREDLRDQNDESIQYASLLEEKEHEYLLYPFWLGNEFKQIEGLKTKFNADRLGYFAYVLSPKVGLFNTSYSWTVKNAVDADLFKETPVDLVLYCRGREETESFLQSDSAQLDCIQDFYFKLNRERKSTGLREADGLNIYFSDLPFSRIKEYKAFVQQFSIYNKLFSKLHDKKYKFYLMLPKICSKLSPQLIDLEEYVDGIYYADFNEYGILTDTVVLNSKVLVEDLSFEEAFDRFRPYHDRSPQLWNIIRQRYIDPNNELAYYQSKIRDTIQDYTIYPYWLGNFHREMPIGSFDFIARIGYMGYVIDPLTGNPFLLNSWVDNNILDDVKLKQTPKDLLIYCRGEASINYFLESDSARIHCIKNIFSLCNRSELSVDKNLVNPDGIAIYFPDFSFEKKREFTQFIKSIRLVKDTLLEETLENDSVIDSIFPYRKLQLNILFPKREKKEESYLSCLLQYVDAIYFADFDQFGLIKSDTTFLTKANVETGLFQEIRNQFYMFQYAPFYAKKMDPKKIESIVETGIKKNNWEIYMFIILFFILILLTIPVVYFTKCCFYQLIQKYIVHTLILVLMLLMEIVLLFIFMIEEMSNEVVFFDPNNLTSFILLLFPIVIVVIYPIISSFQKQSTLP